MSDAQGHTAQLVLAICLLTMLTVIGIWDAGAAFGGRPNMTVSDIIRTWAERWPVLPFLAGFLVGHLFWK